MRKRCTKHKSWTDHTADCRRCRADYQADYRKALMEGTWKPNRRGRREKPLNTDALDNEALRELQIHLYRTTARSLKRLKEVEMEMEARGMLFGVAPESSMLCRPPGDPE